MVYPVHLTTFIVRTWLLYVLYLATFSCPLDYIYLVHLAAFFSVLDSSFSALVWGLGFQVIRGVGCYRLFGCSRLRPTRPKYGPTWVVWVLVTRPFSRPRKESSRQAPKGAKCCKLQHLAFFPSVHLTIFSASKLVK